jgi:hypothetical protein
MDLLTDTVSSVSGTYNEVLTMTTGGMTVNAYRNFSIDHDGVRYPIASNTATTITLDTPTSAYADLSGEEIVIFRPSDYFSKLQDGSYPEIENSLRINNDSMTQEITEAELDYILPLIEGSIHDLMNLDTPLVRGERGYNTIKRVTLAVIHRWNRRRQYNKTTNQMEVYPEVPEFTPDERRDLTSTTPDGDDSWVYDQRETYGNQLYP